MSTFDEHVPHLNRPALGRSGEGTAPDSVSPDSPTDSAAASRARLDQGKALAWEVVQTVLLTVAIFLAVRVVVQNFRVEGASMDPTLQSGQFLLINKIAYARLDGTPLAELVPPKSSRSDLHYLFNGPVRGDIIVFRSPGAPDKDFIKRVIGLPGETVQIKDGRVRINGVELDEPYIKHHASYDLDAKRVPSDAYFVLGDNRPNSSDSHLGWFVPAENIIGRAWVSYWPPGLWGVLQPAAYAKLE